MRPLIANEQLIKNQLLVLSDAVVRNLVMGVPQYSIGAPYIDRGTPLILTRTTAFLDGPAVNPMMIDLVGSDRVRRHSHLRH